MGCPESPSVLSVQAHAIPTVSALGVGAFAATATTSITNSPQKSGTNSKKVKRNGANNNSKEGHTTERLMSDFFQAARVDPNFEQLEKKQLQEALSALSERLLLYKNIEDEKLAGEKQLSQNE